MQIDKNVRAVERLFEKADKQTGVFLSKAAIHCVPGCTKCCHGKSVMASPLEFLPLAYDFYKRDILEDQYWDLKNRESITCFLVQAGVGLYSGQCSEYQHRGVICRLFGAAASVSKHNTKQYSGCGFMKEQIVDADKFQEVLQKNAPVYHTFYSQLRNIDNTYGAMRLPINLAILKAMEIVYYNTRRKRKRRV